MFSILNVRSESDLVAPIRIRDAALVRFGTDGFAATSVRTIAADAGVSPALILHHFGSKDGLREACDSYVFGFFRRMAQHTGQVQPSDNDFTEEAMAMLRYVMRQASEDSPRGNTLIADIIELTRQSLAAQTSSGHIRPSADPDMRAAVLVMLRLGPLLFSGAMQQATGADVLTADGLRRMYRTILEILGSGIYLGPASPDEEPPLELAQFLRSDPPTEGSDRD
ncbi:MAG: TetR family transcriptional regulator [Micrococcales bacterium]|nr:TetR family transcriptional regulator [Micrococcales bacterium]